MGARLYDVLDQTELNRAILAGHVRAQDHQDWPLRILNYTEACAATGAWNRTTMACRGLIYRRDTMEVVARGWTKFFNHGQAGAPEIGLDESVIVTDKLDGSMGIIFPLPDGTLAVATRGSFASEQAVHATEVLRTKYAGFRPLREVTTLVEIIYPGNRIVVDYDGLDDLVLIGGVANDSGMLADRVGGTPLPPATVAMLTGWPGPMARHMDAFTFGEALALQPRPNAEGVVVQVLHSGRRVKIKQADYVALHKVITGLTARTVWEHMSTGRPLVDLLEQLPDEFHAWVVETAMSIDSAVAREHGRLLAAFHKTIDAMPDEWFDELAIPASREGRKQFALAVAEHPDRWALFALLDGRDLTGELLKRAKPDAYVTPYGRVQGEETA
jgi:RNA ligase